jgi:hypothetical protein
MKIYLTHVFVVFAFFDLFLEFGKPLWAVPLLFIGTLLTAVALGALVARAFSEPMNRWLRKRWGQNSGIGSGARCFRRTARSAPPQVATRRGSRSLAENGAGFTDSTDIGNAAPCRASSRPLDTRQVACLHAFRRRFTQDDPRARQFDDEREPARTV